MNNGNALGFVVIGLAMCLLPLAVPAWFPHLAIDGSSTRALWTQFMGAVQCLIGIGYLLRHVSALLGAGARQPAAEQRGAIATADWQPDAVPQNLIAVNFSSAGATVSLDHAAARTAAGPDFGRPFVMVSNVIAFPQAQGSSERFGGDFDSPIGMYARDRELVGAAVEDHAA